jgi:CDP-diglyceride synthetase
MQYSLRFFISWILSAILMYAAFYVWHGIFLNDLNKLAFPKSLFLILAAVVYLIISYVLYRVYEMEFFENHFKQLLVLRGLICGVILGFILFAFVTVLGISFTKNFTFLNLALDFGWQIIEQLIGGFIIGLGKFFIFEPKLEVTKNHIK